MANSVDRRAWFAGALGGLGLAITSRLEAQAQQGAQPGAVGGPAAPPQQPRVPAPGRPAAVDPASAATGETLARTAFARPAEVTKAWTALTQMIDATTVTSTDSAAGALADSFKRIEAGFVFRALAGDEEFSPFHVEPLIDQAADLLDRGVRDRATWDDLASKALTLILELKEYKDLDAIHSEEENAGFYDVDALQSRSERRAELEAKTYQQRHVSRINGMIDRLYSSTAYDRVWNAARKSAWLVGLVAYTWDGQRFGGYTKHKWGATEKDVSDLSVDAAEVQAAHNLDSQQEQAELQRQIFEGGAAVSNERLAAATEKSRWDGVNSDFRRRRTLVARRYQDVKTKAAMDPDGVLNYGKRLPAIRSRFQQDFRDARARLEVISVGLRDLYGFMDPLPAQAQSLDYFDDCLLWVRKSIQSLIRFSRQDQSVIWPLSVREQVGDAAWKQGLKEGGAWTFGVAPALFAGMAHVRLRGISATVVGVDEDDGVWQIEAVPPREAQISHLNGAVVNLDQSRIPGCRLARVSVREARRQPDVVGVVALHNASPIGNGWRVRIVRVVPTKHAGKKIDDVHLDLHLVYRDLLARRS